MINHRHSDTIYGRHVTYDPDYKKYSPGNIVRAWAVQYYFDNGLKKFDLMGMSPKKESPEIKLSGQMAPWKPGNCSCLKSV